MQKKLIKNYFFKNFVIKKYVPVRKITFLNPVLAGAMLSNIDFVVKKSPFRYR